MKMKEQINDLIEYTTESIIFILMKHSNRNLLIEVEACTNCSTHSWCSRHDETKYNEFYEHLKGKVEKVFTKAEVIKNNLPPSYRRIVDRNHGT